MLEESDSTLGWFLLSHIFKYGESTTLEANDNSSVCVFATNVCVWKTHTLKANADSSA